MKRSYLNDEFFSRLEALELNLRADLSGYFGGKHRVKTYGQTVEFADFREYQRGDDIKRIDWNLYARFEKHYLRLFTDERQMHVQIFLDCSASMITHPDKAAHAVGVAAALGFLAVHNTDKVSFNLLKGNHSENPFGRIVGKNAFYRAIGNLEEIEYEGEVDFAAAIASCPDIGSSDGLTVIISDFFTNSDWRKAVDFLCHKKRQVLLVQVLHREEIDPNYSGRLDLIDSESWGLEDEKNMRLRMTRQLLDAYSEALRDIIDEMKTFCRKRGVDFISIDTDTPVEKVIFRELLKAEYIK